MTYQIDQSGKVENTSKPTIIACANGESKTLKIATREKRQLVVAMRVVDYPKQIFIYKIFAALVFLLIKHGKNQSFIIDKEYPGHESFIKETILQLYRKNNLQIPNIDFGLVGKSCEAHRTAIETYRNNRKADIKVSAQDVYSLFYDS